MSADDPSRALDACDGGTSGAIVSDTVLIVCVFNTEKKNLLLGWALNVLYVLEHLFTVANCNKKIVIVIKVGRTPQDTQVHQL